jgi:hypothetical protein
MIKKLFFFLLMLFVIPLYSQEYSAVVIASSQKLETANNIAKKIKLKDLTITVKQISDYYLVIAKLPKATNRFLSIITSIKKDYPDAFEINYDSFIIQLNRLSMSKKEIFHLYASNIPKKDMPILIAILFLILTSAILFFLSSRQKRKFMKAQERLIKQQLEIEQDIGKNL